MGEDRGMERSVTPDVLMIINPLQVYCVIALSGTVGGTKPDVISEQ